MTYETTIQTYKQGTDFGITIKVLETQAQATIPYKHKYMADELRKLLGSWNVRWNSYHKTWLVKLNTETKTYFWQWMNKWNFHDVTKGKPPMKAKPYKIPYGELY